MGVAITPKTMVQMFTVMIAQTEQWRRYPISSNHYYVLQGPKRWMDVFLHSNNNRPFVNIQYGPSAATSVKLYLSNVGEHDYFVLNFHQYNPIRLIGRPPQAGRRIAQFGFKMGDGRKIEAYSDRKCHFEPAEPAVIHDLIKGVM